MIKAINTKLLAAKLVRMVKDSITHIKGTFSMQKHAEQLLQYYSWSEVHICQLYIIVNLQNHVKEHVQH